MSKFTPTVYPAKIFPSSQCGQYSTFNEQLREVLQQIQQVIPNNTTCKSILDYCPSAPSGYYNITTTNGSTAMVYCDMEGTNCGGEGGWTRVAYVNMTQPGATCPQGQNQETYDNNCDNNKYGYVNMTQPGATCPQGQNQETYDNNCDNNKYGYVNMTQPGATCPQGQNQTSYNNKTLCGNNAQSTAETRRSFLRP